MKQYDKVIEVILKQVDSGSIRPGEKLPSIRHLSAELNVSPATIIKAYQLLEERHRIYVIPKSGAYLLEPPRHTALDEATYDFTRMMPDPVLLPYKEYTHCLDQAIEQYKADLFKYAEPEGLVSLRKTLHGHFMAQQIGCPIEHIYVTSGSQQAITLIAQAIYLRTGKGILLEQPSYHVFQDFLALYGIPSGGFPRSLQGIDFGALKQQLQSGAYAAIYIMPNIQNPLGTSLTTADKKKLVQLADRYAVTIIEDDYLTDLVPHETALPLYYYSTSKNVVYVKSFSKSFLPGIRIGACVVTEAYRELFLNLKKAHDLSTPVLTQGALDSFLKNNLYDRHVKRCRQHYAKKAQIAAGILASLQHPQVTVGPIDSGFVFWLAFHAQFPLEAWLDRLKDLGITVTLGDGFSTLSTKPQRGVRLCIAPMSEDQLHRALNQLVYSFEGQ